MTRKVATWLAAATLGLLWASAASATTCPAAPVCTAGGSTFTQTDPGDAVNAVEIDDSALTFVADFTTANQDNSTIASEVEAFLAAEGTSGVTYLGRDDGSGTLPGTGGVHTLSSDGGLSGTWSFDPGLTGEIASFIAIHAGGGQDDILYAINSPGLSGVWDTSENLVGKNNNQGGLSNFDLFDGGSNGTQGGCGGNLPPCPSVPEPISLSLFGAGLAAAAALRLRRKKYAA